MYLYKKIEIFPIVKLVTSLTDCVCGGGASSRLQQIFLLMQMEWDL